MILVCENGHSLGLNTPEKSEEKFCPACGALILRECPHCGKLYSWWADGKMKSEPVSEQELELMKSNLATLETLKRLSTL